METGLYFGLRFFEDASGEPENTYNKDYCKDYVHKEYVHLNPNEDKLLPFGVRIPSTNQGVESGGIELLIVCKDSTIRIGTNPADWIIKEEDGKTYVIYVSNEVILPEENLVPGKYFFRLSIATTGGIQRKFYSDVVILSRSIDATDTPNYTIDYEVVDEYGGTLQASIAGQNIPSGTQRWAGANVEFLATPHAGKVVKEWKVNGEIVDGWAFKNFYKIILQENILVTVEFTDVVYDKEYGNEYLKLAYPTPTPTPTS